jgi:Flp pilus assembly pilin Flp
MNLSRLFSDFRRDKRGVATIELAIFAPILATLVIGVVDMSMAVARKLSIEQAAQRSIEKVMQTTGTSTPDDTIIAEASAQAGVPAENVTVSYRLECDDVHVADYSEKCDEGEIEARYLEVQVIDAYDPMFSYHFGGIAEDGKYHMSATAGMRIQ